MRIYLASDHAGFTLKNTLAAMLREEGYEIEDRGDFSPDPFDDYPDFIFPVAHMIVSDPGSRGVVIGGSGQGEAIAANRISGVRAAVYYGGSLDIVRLSREHNDANILSLGARFLSEEDAKKAVQLWLATPFGSEERHVRRITKLDI